MSRRERKRSLEEKKDKQYQLLEEYEDKIDFSNDPRDIAKFEAEIKRIKERIKEYERELATLRPADTVSTLLFKSIKSVNYTRQKTFIFSYFNKWKPGLILIDGKENFGQGWFTNLVKEHYEQKKGTSFFEVPIQLETGVQENWITILSNLSFKFLGRMISFDSAKQQEDVKEIIEKIASRLENEAIIFLIENPQPLIQTDVIDKFLNSFWLPLCEKVNQLGQVEQLLCFLIDTHQRMTNHPKFTDKLTPDCTYKTLLQIPEIPPITNEDFEKWEEFFGLNEYNVLSEKIQAIFTFDDANRTNFLDRAANNTPPIFFFKELFEALGEDFSNYEDKGLRYEPTE